MKARYARRFAPAYARAERGGASLAPGLFAIALFLLLASLSLYEITRPDRAVTILAAGVAALTDVDRALAENLPLLRERAAAAESDEIEPPGFPLPAAIPREDALAADVPVLRALILQSAAASLYEHGLDSLDRTGEQSADLFSLTSVMRGFARFLTGDAHGQARWLAVAALPAATLLGAATLALNRGFARFRVFGGAVLLAAAPGYLAARMASWLLDRFASDDAFVADLQAVVQAMLAVPARNFLIAGSLGLAIAAAGWAFGYAADRLWPEDAPLAGDEHGPMLPFDAVPGPVVQPPGVAPAAGPPWRDLLRRVRLPRVAPRR